MKKIVCLLAAAKNAETGADIALSGGKVRLRLAKHDLAIVELTAK
jgi:hypothetical protein